MSSPARLAPPPTFLGERDGFSALAWLISLDRYLKLAKIAKEDYTRHAVSYLAHPGPARWFNGASLADDCDYEREFVPAFKLEYVPAQFANSCRTQLMNLKMTSTFSEFVSTFKELLQALLSFVTDGAAQTVAREFAQTAFLDNCPKDLQQMLSGHLLNNPDTSLSQLFTLSEQLDRIYNFAPTPAARIAPRSPPLVTAPAVTSLYGPPPATPMEIDNLMFLANIGRQALTNYSFRPRDNTTSSTFSDNNRPPKLSPDEKTRLLQRGACFRCRRDGHMANQCTAFGRQQQQHRQLNNVATEEISSKSGKANDN
ncbi:hypothetical protein EDD11_009338 [Mortierella claussenii]|nr:hypothetical protein EDD11_009338 [Mortierella claussenii]